MATRWEYMAQPLGPRVSDDAIRRANDLGGDGWELVAVQNQAWIFKRALGTPGVRVAHENQHEPVAYHD